jgi:ketosteroid isomerase-like protein
MIFAAGFKGERKVSHKSSSDVQEIYVNGDWAYLWNYLVVTMTSKEGGAPNRRAGNVLSVLRKQTDGSWVMFRDANLLSGESA